MKTLKNYINGKWVDAFSGKTRKVINPGTGEVICLAADGNREDAKAAIQAAKESFYGKGRGEWRRMPEVNRIEVLLKIADLFEARRDEIARVESENQGKPLWEAEIDVDDTIHNYRHHAGLCGGNHGDTFAVNDGFGPVSAQTKLEPAGVAAIISPWNCPLLLSNWAIAPALAAGCSIVFKPASITPCTAQIMAEIFEEAGIPQGTFNLVMGGGSTVGQEMAESMDVDVISFTGSTDVGKSIVKASAGNLKKVSLELGGKSPSIVFADVVENERTFEDALEWAQIGILYTAGQVCSSSSRLLLEESIKDKFVQRLVERFNKVSIGIGINNPKMGAIASKEQLEKIEEYVEIGKKEGATLLCGGERYTEGECANGYFFRPTIFDNCNQSMRIVQEEIFGPVLCIETFKTMDEAIEMANDTPYGLAAAVFTTKNEIAQKVVAEFRAGTCWINMANIPYMECPWGGYKQSGLGREIASDGFHEFCEKKAILNRIIPEQVGLFDK